MVKLLFSHSTEGVLPSIGLLVARIIAGLAMAFQHGFSKIPPSEVMITKVAELGFPVPVLFSWLASMSEFLGGVFIVLGILTRPSAFFWLVTMGVAAFGIHANDPFAKKELALLYFSCAAIFITAGAGRFSIDHYVQR